MQQERETARSPETGCLRQAHEVGEAPGPPLEVEGGGGGEAAIPLGVGGSLHHPDEKAVEGIWVRAPALVRAQGRLEGSEEGRATAREDDYGARLGQQISRLPAFGNARVVVLTAEDTGDVHPGQLERGG